MRSTTEPAEHLAHPDILVAAPEGEKGVAVAVVVATAPRRRLTEQPLETVTDQTMGKLVLVIDDDALVLDSMRGALKSWGCNVVTASSGAAALACLAELERPPDLIISDYRLAD